MSIGLIVEQPLAARVAAPVASARTRGTVKVAADGVIFLAAIAGAYALRFDGAPPPRFHAQFLLLLTVLPLVRLAVGFAVGTHRTSWRLFGLPEALVVLRGVGLVSAGLVVLRLAMPWVSPAVAVVPLGVIALEGLIGLSTVLAMRVAVRIIDESRARERVRGTTGGAARPALLVGAGRAGRMAARELKQRPDAGFEPVGFVDDDPTRHGQVIEGLPVLGKALQAARIARKVGAKDVILTMPSAPRRAVAAIVERCRAAGLEVQTVPGLFELIAGRVGITRIRPVAIEDLLGRDVVQLDEGAAARVRDAFAGRRILVTGAGGSIGSELCRQLALLGPASIVLLERNENNLFDIEQEMRAALGDRAIPCLADVRNVDEIDRAFEEYRPEVVFHAAAYKHVPMMERYPAASVDNNVRGTRVVVEAAHRYAVSRFLLVSTDKAVNPTSLMGASKRAAELVLHARGGDTPMRSCAVRFGNVLGSRGSVLHTFRRQIENGGPVTVTHEDVTRFFMTIPEAVRLVLQAAAIGEGGETFLLDMGESVRILDMARQMIRLAGLTEDDVPIEIVGLRPGEKLYEELLLDAEDASPSGAEGIMLARAAVGSSEASKERVAALEHAADVRDVEAIRRIMGDLTGYLPPAHGPQWSEARAAG
ncbi:MAG: nucleoside-diphosphate sugar epimerase/dehydratase [Myxococcota bacterium]